MNLLTDDFANEINSLDSSINLTQIWIDKTGIILSWRNLPTDLRSFFRQGQYAVSHLNPEASNILRQLFHKVLEGSNLETSVLPLCDRLFDVTVTPEMNSKNYTGFIMTLVEQETAGSIPLNQINLPFELCRNLLDNTRFWVDAFSLKDYRILVWNRGAERISGYSWESVSNTSVTWGWLYPETEYRMSIWSWLEKNLSAPRVSSIRSRIRCRDGSVKIMEWTSHWLKDSQDQRIGVLNLGFEVTRETIYHNALRTSVGEYRTLADNSPDLIARFDQQRQCSYTNATSSSTNPFGLSRTLTGKPLSELMDDKELAKTLENRIQEVFISRHIKSFEITTSLNPGNRVYEIHLVPEVSPEEIIRSILFIARDITLRRRTEYRIRTAERFEAAGRVACELTHNINNRLTVLNGKLEILRRRLSAQGISMNLFDDILSITSEVSLEIRDSLSFGQSPASSDLIELNSLIGNVVEDVKATAASTIDFDIRLYPEPIFVSGSRQQLKNALLNMLINALDAMNDRGALSLYIQRERIIDNESNYYDWDLKNGDYVRVDIADSGMGIPDAIKTKIFDPLFTTKSSREGSGMGLATVYSIISAMDGAIDFVSREGEGTCFSFLLPEVNNMDHSNHHPLSLQVERRSAGTKDEKSILWVDDNDTVLDVAVEMVETFGYSAIPASSGKEALAIYKKMKSKISLVVLDVHMPEMDGWDTHAALMKIDPNVRVVICTGRGFSDEAEKMMESGAFSLLHKPFTAEDLLELLQDLTER